MAPDATEIPWSDLTYEGKPLPAVLGGKGAVIVTPLGTFSATSQKAWTRTDVKTPYPTGSLVPAILPQKLSDQELVQGFYETSGRSYGQRGPWTDTQLTRTPEDWVYVHAQDKRGYQGFWGNPACLDKLPWK